MNADDYKNIIIKMLEDTDDLDKKFLIQAYTIIKHYIDKRRRH